MSGLLFETAGPKRSISTSVSCILSGVSPCTNWYVHRFAVGMTWQLEIYSIQDDSALKVFVD